MRKLLSKLSIGLVVWVCVAGSSLAAAPTGGNSGRSAQAGHDISGKVTDHLTGLPVQGATVEIYGDSASFLLARTCTAADGTYGANVGTGQFKLYIEPPEHSNYLDQWWNGQAAYETADAVTVTADTPASGIDVALIVGGRVSGTVTSQDTQAPVSGTVVFAYDAYYNYLGTGQSDSNGFYDIDRLPAGECRIQFSTPWQQNYLPEWWDNPATFEAATPVMVYEGYHTPDINAALATGGQVQGRVVEAAGMTGVADVMVELFVQPEYSSDFAWTHADGSYTLYAVRTGNYKLRFSPPDASTLAWEWWNGQPFFDDGQAVAVTEGQFITGYDAALESSGRIEGTVKSEDTGAALKSTLVTLYDAHQRELDFTSTGNDGRYAFTHLPAGAYRVFFGFSGSTDYLTEWWDNGSSFETATPVIVPAGSSVTGIDASLAVPPYGSISGRVTGADGRAGLAGVYVYAYNMNYQSKRTATTDANGNYNLTKLMAGDYKVYFSPPSSLNYIKQWWGEAYSFYSSPPVTVIAYAATNGIDATLPVGGMISGQVTPAGTRAPVSGASVSVNSLNESYVNGATSGSDGNYTVKGLPGGQYKVRFTPPWGSTRGCEFYPGQETFAAGSAVAVTIGQTTPGIHAALRPGGSVSGRVTDAATGRGIAGATPRLLGGQLSNQIVETAADGSYTLTQLSAGTFKVQFSPPWNSDYRSVYYNGQETADLAQTITVTRGSPVPNINGALGKGSRIKGRVTDEATGLGVSGVSTMAYDAQAKARSSGSPNADGDYTISGLAPGEYRVKLTPLSGTYGEEWWLDQREFGLADVITVGAEATVTGIDAQLGPGGGITGRVTEAGARAGIATVRVVVYDTKYEQLRQFYSDYEGFYRIGNLPPGFYKVYFDTAASPQFESEWYDGAAAFETATVIEIVAGETLTVNAELERACSADLNLDGVVDARDVLLLAAAVAENPVVVAAGNRCLDGNGDGRLDILDVLLVALSEVTR